jgi:hypothetical protein
MTWFRCIAFTLTSAPASTVDSTTRSVARGTSSYERVDLSSLYQHCCRLPEESSRSSSRPAAQARYKGVSPSALIGITVCSTCYQKSNHGDCFTVICYVMRLLNGRANQNSSQPYAKLTPFDGPIEEHLRHYRLMSDVLG